MTQKYKVFNSDDAESILIQLEDKQFEKVIAKISNIELNKQGELEFEMELPKGMSEYYVSEPFCQLVQEAVGDMVKKSIEIRFTILQQQMLSEYEQRIREAFKPYNYNPDEGKTFIEMFGNKGYVIVEDNSGRLTAQNTANNKTYYFDMPDQLAYLKKELSGSGIILSS